MNATNEYLFIPTVQCMEFVLCGRVAHEDEEELSEANRHLFGGGG